MRFRRAFCRRPGSLSRRSKVLLEALEGRAMLSVSIWDNSVPPAPAAMSNDINSTEVGLRFRSDTPGDVTGIRFYKANFNTGIHVGNLWDTAGNSLGSAVFTGESAEGWQQVSFASPVHIDANTTYIASYFAPNGHYTVTNDYFKNSGASNGPLHALQDGIDGPNGVYSYAAASTFPNQTFTSSNYWVDVLFDPSPQVPLPPQVIDVRPADQTTYASPGASPTVTFNVPMDPTSINAGTVLLRGPRNVLVDATVTYDDVRHSATIDPTGQLSANATYTIVVRGGATGVRSAAGDTMAADVTSTFRVQPFAPDMLWPTSPVPEKPDSGDGQSTELGVRFQADTDGFVTGLRFYKGPANTGQHLGTLWSDDGQRLADVTFTAETEEGWQLATFDSPVPIEAGKAYVASYLAPNGHYSVTNGYFAAPPGGVNGGVTSGHLHAYEDLEDGGRNGVYKYVNTPTFPDQTATSNNYWVDVLFFPQAAGSSNAPPTAATQSVNVDEGHQVAITLDGSDDQTATGDLTFRIDSLPAGGVLKVDDVAVTAGQTFPGPPTNLTFEADGSAGGTTTSFKFTVLDPEGLASDPATVSIAIAVVNDRPVASAGSVSVAEDARAVITLVGSDDQTAAANLRFRVDTLPTRGVLKYNGLPVAAGQSFVGAPSNLTYEPGAQTEGGATDAFTFTVIDGDDAASNPATVAISVDKAVADGAVVLSGGVLRIGGTSGNDLITVSRTFRGTFRVTFGLRIVSDTIPVAGVSEIRVWGRQGIDAIALLDLSTRSLISGGAGTDILAGSNGDDLILGGDGDDLLTGFGGNDVIVGGDGHDALLGMDGHDVLIAGEVSAAMSAPALRALGAEWAASKASTPAEAAAVDSVVTDDNFDLLSGGGGSDWFVISRGDGVLDYGTRTGSRDQVTYVS